MIAKRKNSFLKRIIAFVMVFLLVFTMIPWENCVILAEDGVESLNATSKTYSFTVEDENGNVTNQLFSESGDALRELLDENDGIYTFTLSEVKNQRIQIICADKAFNANGESNTFNQTYENITVSASWITILFVNGWMYYLLGGFGAIFVALIVFIFLKKRKDSSEKNN